MTLSHSRLTAQGQVSVPAAVRRKLGLAPGSVIEWAESSAGVLVRRAGRNTSEEIHQALFGKPPRPRSLAQLKAGIRKHVRRRHARR